MSKFEMVITWKDKKPEIFEVDSSKEAVEWAVNCLDDPKTKRVVIRPLEG